MELGQKLKAARLEAGLSQRQLCGDTITRNMLSQIENGTAKPSYATLQVLSARLGKPESYFWEEAPSQNLGLLHKAAQAGPAEALELLKGYLTPDPILDDWYYLLSSRCRMDLAEQALSESRTGYAQALLQQAEELGSGSAAFRSLYSRRLTLLRYQAGSADAASLAESLPDNTSEMMLRAKAALDSGDPEKCLAYLAAADRQPEASLLLKGDALLQKQAYEAAAECFLLLETSRPAEVYSRLEVCYREMGNFQKAYEYACKQR